MFPFLNDGKATVRVPRAAYAVIGDFYQPASDTEADTLALVTDPEFVVDKPTTVPLDARAAEPVSMAVEGRRDVRPREASMAYARKRSDGWFTFASIETSVVGDYWNLLAVPTAKPTIGSAEFSTGSRLELPAYRVRSLGSGGEVIPVLEAHPGTRFTGTKTLVAVDAGTAQPEQLTGVRDRLAVIQSAESVEEILARARAAEQAGAAALMFHDPAEPGFSPTLPFDQNVVGIPAVSTTRAAAAELLDLIRTRQVEVRIDGVAVSPFRYDLVKAWNDRIPAGGAFRAKQRDFAQVRESYGTHSDRPGTRFLEVRRGRTPGFAQHGSWLLPDLTAPRRLTSYVLGGPVRWNQTLLESLGDSSVSWYSTLQSYRAGQQAAIRWFTPAATSDVRDNVNIVPAVHRERDWLSIALSPFAHGGLQVEPSYVPYGAPGKFAMTVRRNGELLGTAEAPIEGFVVPTDPADYQIELDAQRDLPSWRYSTRIRTTWNFRSAGGDDDELLPLIAAGVEVPQADLLNRVKTGQPTTIKLGLRHQAGSKAGRFTSAKLEISYDASTWTELSLTSASGNRYTTTVTHPIDQAGKTVHLRITATDENGGRLAQEVTRAYALKN